MKEYLKDKNIRLRCKKNYSDAHTHIVIGRVVEENSAYLVVKGRTFHYSRLVDRMVSQVFCGDVLTRVIPWGNVEVIHVLGHKVDCQTDIAFDQDGNLVLQDEKHTVIAGCAGN